MANSHIDHPSNIIGLNAYTLTMVVTFIIALTLWLGGFLDPYVTQTTCKTPQSISYINHSLTNDDFIITLRNNNRLPTLNPTLSIINDFGRGFSALDGSLSAGQEHRFVIRDIGAQTGIYTVELELQYKLNNLLHSDKITCTGYTN